ncbi:uncharacterized protein [Cherax quadricarinatus]|uniref:uncharacterized protein n=1 Tax=Cherax quadricarinatus TaxID=27406 RepID=UPI002378B768|nr:uncharacterized protein LOC128700262 [Cherax quadricarinatus]
MKQCGSLILTAALLVLFVGSGTGELPFQKCFNATTIANMKAQICTSVGIPDNQCKQKEPKIKACCTNIMNANKATIVNCMSSTAGFTVPPKARNQPIEALEKAIKTQPTLCTQVPGLMTCFETQINMTQKLSQCLSKTSG